MTRLLVTGSRDATAAMLEYAYRVVERAKVNGWEIVVGDASGVDAAVYKACKELQVFGECFGITEYPRCYEFGNDYMSYVWVKQTIVYGKRDVCVYPGADYLERDRQMVRHAQHCIAIWNGKHARHGGPSGTEYTFNYARKLYPIENVHLIDFSKKVKA